MVYINYIWRWGTKSNFLDKRNQKIFNTKDAKLIISKPFATLDYSGPMPLSNSSIQSLDPVPRNHGPSHG